MICNWGIKDGSLEKKLMELMMKIVEVHFVRERMMELISKILRVLYLD